MEYKSSVSMVEEFVEGCIWKDIECELHIWLNDVRDHLEDPEGILKLEELKKLQGNAEALRNVLDIPETIIRNIQISLEERKEKENG